MKSTDLNAADIVKLYTLDLKSSYDIAMLYNTYPNMINRLLRKHGVTLRSKSDAQSQALQNGTVKHPTKGTIRDDSTKLKISKKTRENWKALDESEKQRRIDIARDRWLNMTDDQKKEMSLAASKAVRLASKEGSKLEIILLDKLNKLKYQTLHHQHIIPNDKMEVDLYLPHLKVGIEIDGPSHFLPIWGEDKLKQVMVSDAQKNGHIISKGFVLIRIKYKANNITLTGVDDLINELTSILESVKKEFPKNINERLIEIDFE